MKTKIQQLKQKKEKLERWIDIGINSFLSCDKEGKEFMTQKDIANLKIHLSKKYRNLISAAVQIKI